MAGMAAALAFGTVTVPSRYIQSSKDVRVANPLRNVSFLKFGASRDDCRLRSPQPRAFLDIQNDPIVKEALKEPVAFLGGVFAGLLRLDLNEEPLREWVAKTAEAAGIATEEPESTSSDDIPSEIEIE